MKKRASNESGLVGLLVVLGVVGFFGIGLFSAGYSWRNDVIGLQNQLKATHGNAKNVMDSVVKRIREVAQVPAMYADDLAKVAKSAIEGRYGEDGSKAVFQWIQEHNPNVDSAVYLQLQRVIEAGRKEFQGAQTEVLAVKQALEDHLQKGFGGFWAWLLGYPTINLDDYKIVTSDRTEKAFETGKDDEIKLR